MEDYRGKSNLYLHFGASCGMLTLNTYVLGFAAAPACGLRGMTGLHSILEQNMTDKEFKRLTRADLIEII